VRWRCTTAADEPEESARALHAPHDLPPQRGGARCCDAAAWRGPRVPRGCCCVEQLASHKKRPAQPCPAGGELLGAAPDGSGTDRSQAPAWASARDMSTGDVLSGGSHAPGALRTAVSVHVAR